MTAHHAIGRTLALYARCLGAALSLALLGLPAAAAPAPAGGGKIETQLGTTPSRIVTVDRIVAIVNDDVITQNELNERVQLVLKQLQQQGGQLPDSDSLSRQVLERMIDDRVLLQVAKETGVKIDDAQLDRTIERIAQENKLTLTGFRDALERDGVRYTRFRDDVQRELMVQRLREHEVDNNVVVTDAEVETELARQAKDANASMEYQVAHILVTVPQGANAAQIEARRQRANLALTMLRGGETFARVAAQYSDAPDSLQGGGLGWRDSSRLPPLFLDTLQRMRPGDVSDILKSPNGFHIVTLVDKRTKASEGVAGVEQSHVRHILIRTTHGVTDSEARDQLLKLRERIVAGADFADVAKRSSDDASAARGGDLGWIAPGDTVPDFERVVTALQPGDLSEPFQSPFGWHIVQVLERRSEAPNDEHKKNAARQAIRTRKAEEAYQDWMRQERDRAYVDNRFDER